MSFSRADTIAATKTDQLYKPGMPELSRLTDDFAEAERAGRMARHEALATGHSVIFIDWGPLG